MEYSPMNKDVLGLYNVFNMDLMKQLDEIMSPPVSTCSAVEIEEDCVNVGFNVSLSREDSYLETIRNDAFEEFRRNGIEQELDEVDLFQYKLRERTMTAPVEPENPVAAEYMKRRKSKKKTKTVCVFCKNNNEQPSVYSSHVLKDSEGRTTCPILRKYTCPICGVKGGDQAHTIRYCSKNIDKELNPGLGSLMKGPRLSTGKFNPRCAN